MAYDCFLSYSTRQEQMALAVASDLERHGLSVFLAPISLIPGVRWSIGIRQALAASDWVIFLASQDARQSPWVQQELGMAIQANKIVVPVVWDCDPSDLPGWVQEFQALDLRNMTPEQMQARVIQLGGTIRMQKDRRTKGVWIISSLVGLALLFGRGNDDNEEDEDEDEDDY